MKIIRHIHHFGIEVDAMTCFKTKETVSSEDCQLKEHSESYITARMKEHARRKLYTSQSEKETTQLSRSS